jgi:Protein of unknown function (DUF1353)
MSRFATVKLQSAIERIVKRGGVVVVEANKSTDNESKKMEGNALTGLQKFQIVVGIVVSCATVVIGWQTFQVSARTNENNAQLKLIEQQLAQTRFGFERMRDVYDRTEKYLASAEQNPARGRVLVVLINSLPDTQLRTELLSVVTETAKLDLIAAKAADLNAGVVSQVAKQPDDPSFSGDLSLSFNPDLYEAITQGEITFTDSRGTKWTVPKGFVVTGSSVPRFYWSIIGSPLTSNYTIPMALLDYYSTQRKHTPDEVYTMFYESLIKADVSESTSKLLYLAVKGFGPRWSTN